MIAFIIHTMFICFIGSVMLWLIDEHERDARMGRLLKFLVLAAGQQILQDALPPDRRVERNVRLDSNFTQATASSSIISLCASVWSARNPGGASATNRHSNFSWLGASLLLLTTVTRAFSAIFGRLSKSLRSAA
jgi:hypothetical protein